MSRRTKNVYEFRKLILEAFPTFLCLRVLPGSENPDEDSLFLNLGYVYKKATNKFHPHTAPVMHMNRNRTLLHGLLRGEGVTIVSYITTRESATGRIEMVHVKTIHRKTRDCFALSCLGYEDGE